MRSMTREEIALRAHVDRKTISNQIKRHWDELWALGMRPYEISEKQERSYLELKN